MNENITLKIDNREISVPKGTTILEAARELGIDIPTLCYMNLKDLCIKNAPASWDAGAFLSLGKGAYRPISSSVR